MKNMRRNNKISKARRHNQRNNQERKNRNSGGLADPRAESVRKTWEEKNRMKKASKTSRGPCCKDDAARLAKNEQLLSNLRSMKMDQVWNDNRGTFEPKVPRGFIRANRSHLPHFRQYVKAMNLPYKF